MTALDKRRAGILLHPTSLPGRYGIGDLGPDCLRFIDWMEEVGFGLWQILPLGPTGFGDSPYQCFSAFAGNPLLVSPDVLMEEGLLTRREADPLVTRPERVDYGPVIEWKTAVLRIAHERFANDKSLPLHDRFRAFRRSRAVKSWLEDYAVFRVLKDIHDGRPWDQWPTEYRRRDPKALREVRKTYAGAIEFHEFCQFLFFEQWDRVRKAAHARNILIVGDAPIYVAYDSADTWANQELFQLNKEGLPTEVAGVPPDYFSATGQLWGNPLYRWDKLEETKYDWWMRRMEAILSTVDIVRLDHFRGFMGYWAVPFGETTAVEGKWRRGPGAAFFAALKKKFKPLPIIAEDLGEITPDVIEVRDQFDLPGMKVLQFAWGIESMEPLIPSPGQQFQPHHCIPNSVVYTGTHDNDTTVGWYRNSSEEVERHHMRVYLATDGAQPHWDLIRAAFGSGSLAAIVPVQDFLGLDSEARMNFPSRAEGNWSWRLQWKQINNGLTNHIRNLLLLYQRHANPPEIAVAQDDPERRNYLED